MRIGIISDTHDQLARTSRALAMLQKEGVEALIHCGDFVEAEILAECAVIPCHFVFGNNDSNSVPELRRVAKQTDAVCLEWGGVIELAGKRIGVTHGHMTSDLREVLKKNPHYLFTGHSHIPHDRQEGAVRRINPGAIARAERYTVAILDLSSDELSFLEVPR